MQSKERAMGRMPIKANETEPVKERATELARYQETKTWLSEQYTMLQEMANDSTVREGVEPAVRTAVNTAIALVDVVPGVGELVSWGADAAKILAELKYKADRARVEKEGGDPDNVERSSIDLTPDVPVSVAVLTEFIEPITGGLFPSHAIEGSIQLYHDWPNLRDAAIRMREIYQGELETSAEEAEAALVFDVEYNEAS